MRMLCLLFLVGALGCESARPRLDPDLEDARVGDARLIDGSTQDGGGPDGSADMRPADGGRDGRMVDPPDGRTPDGAMRDLAVLDGRIEDAAPPMDAALTGDAAADAGPADAASADMDIDAERVEDGGPVDGEVADSAADAVAPPDGSMDGLRPDQAVEPTGFVTGVAQAADGRTVVEVSAAGVVARTNAAGGFRLGPLPVGPVELQFEAERHETRTRQAVVAADEETPIDEPVLLYRGRRIAPAPGAQLRFSNDARWVIWSEEDALWRRGTADGAVALELLPRGFEVFLGFVPGRDAVAVRRRVQAGLAGNIDVIDLADAARQQLFVEAQPWVRWRGETALGMVGTRDGLSTLQLGSPGEMPQVLGEGVPWLLVTTLVDGEPAWAQADGDAFGIWRGGDAIPAAPIAPEFAASSDFLSTTPGRTGLLWLSPFGELVRWEPDQAARVLADDVIPTPRPRFLSGGRLLFWRADPAEPGLERLFMVTADGAERLIISTLDGNSLRLSGERYYIVRPEDGLYTGRLDAPAAAVRLLPGERVQYATQGQGIIALVDGVAWTAIPGGVPIPLGVEGLTTLQALSVGATAWQAAGGVLWWLPGPEMAAPATALVRDAPRARRVVERGNAAVYPLGAEGYFRAPIPPGERTVFADAVTELTSISPALALGYTPEGWLYGIDPAAGTTTGWAPVVTRLVVSGNRQWALYVSDRGTYLVPLE